MDNTADELRLVPDRKKLFRLVIPSFSNFNIYSSVAKHTTALGPVLVATMVSKMPDWDVEVIDENNFHHSCLLNDEKQVDHVMLQLLRRADAVGFYGGLSSTVPRLYQLAQFYKSEGCLTLAGGQHFVEDNIDEGLDHDLDFLLIGEGEITIRELLTALAAGTPVQEVNGIAFKDADGKVIITPPREESMNLDQLPLPDFSLLRYARVSLYPVSWVRGCGMNCEFCTVKGKVRCPSHIYLIHQISALYERFGATNFFIVDDLFGQYREETLTFCRELREYQQMMNVKFFITVQIRLDKANDTELLKEMRLANIRLVAIGYESPIAIDLAAMNKRLNAMEMVELTRKFHRQGLLVHGMFIFGYPLKEGETHISLTAEGRMKEYWRFIRAARIDTIQILLPVPLPGTVMTHRLQAAGRVFPKELAGWEFYDGNFPLFIPDSPLTPEDMFMASKTLMRRFYRFRYMFYIGWNVLSFPTIIFPIFNLKTGWRRWYKSWRNNIWRFIGWIILRKWTKGFDQDAFFRNINDYHPKPPQNE